MKQLEEIIRRHEAADKAVAHQGFLDAAHQSRTAREAHADRAFLLAEVERLTGALARIISEGVPVEVDDTPEPLAYAVAQVMVLRMIARAALNQEPAQ